MQSRRVLCGIKENRAKSSFRKSFSNRRNFQNRPIIGRVQRRCAQQALEKLSPMKDIQHHGTFILHSFEYPFLQNESVGDTSFQFFKCILLTIGT